MSLYQQIANSGDPISTLEEALRKHFAKTGRVPTRVLVGRDAYYLFNTDRVSVRLEGELHTIPIERQIARGFDTKAILID